MRAAPPPSSTRPARALVPPQSTTTTRPRSAPVGCRVKVRSILREPLSPASPRPISALKARARASSAGAPTSNEATTWARRAAAEPDMGVMILPGVGWYHDTHVMSAPERRKTVAVDVGGVKVGGRRPIVVQSMTNTDTADVAGTVAQVNALHAAGSELVRVTVNTEAAARAVPEIVKQVTVPVIGDFHYNGHVLLTKYPACAKALAKYRINPGNVGAKRRDEHFRTIVQVAIDQGKPVRIGVNWGSLDQQLLAEMMDANAKLAEPRDARDVTMDAMVESAVRSAALAEETGLPHDRIILSAKVSGVQDLVEVYRKLAATSDYPLHLGLTEAGMGTKGVVASSAALAILLQEGIGDTIRVSLTPRPAGDRTEEVRVAQQILQSLGIRSFSPQVTACPGCGRTTSTFFQE